MSKSELVIENLIRRFVYLVMISIVILIGVALLYKNESKEAHIGSFKNWSLNDGWTLKLNGEESTISLPYICDAKDGDLITIENILPSDLTDSSCIMTRTRLEDIYIYVNGELRESYASEKSDLLSYYIPNAYVVTELSSADQNAKISIDIRVKANGVINEVVLGQGDNTWFGVLSKNIFTDATIFVVLVLGLILMIIAAIIQRFIQDFKPTFFLGVLMVDIAVWMISESELKQLVLSRPSLSCYFTYISFGLFGALTCLFFDEVQEREHHKSYLIMEAIVCVQLAANTILHVFHILEFHRTLVANHFWLVVEFIIVLINVILDIKTKQIKKYKTIAIGIVCFLALSVGEFVVYYFAVNPTFGRFVCTGLVILTMTAIMQVFLNQIRISKEHLEEKKDTLFNVIKTIAHTIDAKDEYTGGHSERVGYYATILSRAVADKYGFTEEDIERINYIGNMHDIGKIGVPDVILNKPGRLTDEEFDMMKKHVDMGAELVNDMEGAIEGLYDGILYHHERYDGKGYPRGLEGENIPLIARIICLADCYDAMTSNRIYRKKLSDDAVRDEFIRCDGTQFDPYLTKVFVELIDGGKLNLTESKC